MEVFAGCLHPHVNNNIAIEFKGYTAELPLLLHHHTTIPMANEGSPGYDVHLCQSQYTYLSQSKTAKTAL